MQRMTHRHTRELDIFNNEHHDSCTICNVQFKEGDTAHLGFMENDLPALLCNDCASKLNETVERYYWQERKYEVPASSAKLWRYMDLSKFISLISKRELYFSAAKCFADPFEGAKGMACRKEIWDSFYRDFLKRAILTAPGTNPERFTDEELGQEVERFLAAMHTGGEDSREDTFISCWHMNEFESEAMWKLYSKDTTNAIAIQTTCQRLYEALGKEPKIAIGKVNYIDFSKRFSSLSSPYWYKQKSFDYEREVRAIAINIKKRGENGVYYPVDIDLLIENIYVSPYSPQWFYDVVRSVLDKYELPKIVLRSQMTAIPFY